MMTEKFVTEFVGAVGNLSDRLKALAVVYRSKTPIPNLGYQYEHRHKVADLLDAAAVYVRLAYEVKMGQNRYGGSPINWRSM